MKKLSVFILFLALGLFGASAQIAEGFAGRMQHILDSTCARYKVKGASAAVLVPGAGVWTGVFGESHQGRPIRHDMLLPIGSNTKTYTAAILLKMQEEGKLSLDDTIGQWIVHPNIDGQITIRQMLNHTSGIFGYTDNPDWGDSLASDFERIWQPEEQLQFILEPYFPKGQGWGYSNSNYLLAGIIIEKVLHKSYKEALREYISQPLGLEATIFFPNDPATAEIPHPWTARFTPTQRNLYEVWPEYSNTAFFGMAHAAGAIMATAEENAMFWSGLMNGQLLNSQSRAEMNTAYTLVPGQHYGLGVFRFDNLSNGRTVFSHGGTCLGYINENLYDTTNGVVVTLLTNQDSIPNGVLLLQVVRALHKGALNTPALSVRQNLSAPAVSVYPNPVADVLNIDLQNQQAPTQMHLYDLTGKQVLTETYAPGIAQLQTGKIQPGLYILKLRSSNGHPLYTGKVQVVR